MTHREEMKIMGRISIGAAVLVVLVALIAGLGLSNGP
jgi:hypothetical protein